MKICLAMIGRFEERDGIVFGDGKNIKAITRYLKLAEVVHVVARRTTVRGLYERKPIDSLDGRVVFHLYDERNGPLDAFRAARDYARTLRQCAEPSDLVLCWSQPAILWIWRTAATLRKPLFVYVGGCMKEILFSYRSPFKRLMGILLFRMARWVIWRADYVHYVTETVLQEKYPTAGLSIGATYAAIQTALPPEAMEARSRRIGSLPRPITLGMIGYLNRVKGVDTAIQALSTLEDQYRLRILGGGNRAWLQKIADRYGVGDRVWFDGTLPPGAPVDEWLDQIDIYLQPSRSEGLPRATIEAMSRGCPVVASSAGGLRELVERPYRHDPGHWHQLGDRVRRLVSHPDEWVAQSRRNQSFVRKYSRDRMDAIIDRFYQRIQRDLKASSNPQRGNP